MAMDMLQPERTQGLAGSGETVVSLRDVTKSYADSVAVEGLSLDVSKGELVCLLGPSGCGKTTTLRMVAGFVEPTGGRVFIHGVDVTDLPPHRRDIGMVFQSYALFPHMTVTENIEYGLINVGLPRGERSRRVAEMLERVELGAFASRHPRELSGGQQQRVAVARALALRPQVLLLDEPFSNLDAQLRVRLREDLQRLIRSLNMTTLFVTHDQDEALTMADRVVVMNRGRVEQVGRSEEIYETPASRFVAEFIGWCSVVEGCFLPDGGFRTNAGTVLPLDGSAGPGVLVIRPEQVHSAEERPGLTPVQGVIEGCSYYGSSSRLKVRIGSDSLLMEARHGSRAKPHLGDSIAIVIDPHNVHRLPC